MTINYKQIQPIKIIPKRIIFKCIKESPKEFFIILNDGKIDFTINLIESGVVFYQGTPTKYNPEKANFSNGIYEVLNSPLIISIYDGSFGIIQAKEFKHLILMTDNYKLELVARGIEDITEQL